MPGSLHDDARRLLDDVERFLRQDEELNGPLLLDPRRPEASVTAKRSDRAAMAPKLFGASPSLPAYPPEPWTASSTLEELRTAICECQKCPLGKTRTKFVFGVGNPRADIVLIGEAPGADEDLQGEPFVGRAGQLLNKIIEAVQFKREEVFICNILKCRPPNNRQPAPEEIEHCEPYLWRQLELLQPKLILCLGLTAGQALLKTKESLGKLRGQWHSYCGIPTMVTFHPAALLRNPNWKRPTWEDVQAFRKRYEEMVKK
ncbi:MAG: uracil-DNA glycosylase [Bacteroidetes bacterium]|jgi:DNA polymerase|nr:uracil-DNA glycosylase [Bacteroidota bacterium]